MKKIIFLTTHNLASNPRLVKEIRVALAAGYKVAVLCFTFRNWSQRINDGLLKEFNSVQWILIPADRKPLLSWLTSVIAEKGCRLLLRTGKKNISVMATAVSRRNLLLLTALKKIDHADWVIGHNPGALYATYKASQLFNCKAGFDVEDYHPGEGHDIHLQKITRRLMQQILPKINYASFASQLIREEVYKDVGQEGSKWMTVLNYFSSKEFTEPEHVDGPLKIVWFSQNISAGRGLEYILPVIKRNDQVQLHLFGNTDPVFYNEWINGSSNITLHEPMQQAALHQALCRFDVGLAIEPSKDKNNDLAISNKILAYMQAGLFVLASETSAQKKYLEHFPSCRLMVDISDEGTIEERLNTLIREKANIRHKKKDRFNDHRNMNWENESIQLTNAWK